MSGINTEWEENENAIEWLGMDETATVTLRPGKLQSRVIRLAKEYPDQVEIKKLPEQNHGYLLAHIPRKWIRINPPQKREMTEEQRASLAERGRASLAAFRKHSSSTQTTLIKDADSAFIAEEDK